MIKSITNDTELNNELNKAGNRLVVLDFYATWCRPCCKIQPIIESLAEEYKQVLFLRTDVDINIESSTKYEISSMPTFLFIKNNKVIERFSGATRDKLNEAIKRLI